MTTLNQQKKELEKEVKEANYDYGETDWKSRCKQVKLTQLNQEIKDMEKIRDEVKKSVCCCEFKIFEKGKKVCVNCYNIDKVFEKHIGSEK